MSDFPIPSIFVILSTIIVISSYLIFDETKKIIVIKNICHHGL